MADFSPIPDANVHFLITCIEETPITIDFHGVAQHMGTSVSTERSRYATLAGRVHAANADRNTYFYLLMAIELYGQRPNFGRVAAAIGTTKAAARMKFTRLAYAIHQKLASETDSE